jgi:hypothetical protein
MKSRNARFEASRRLVCRCGAQGCAIRRMAHRIRVLFAAQGLGGAFTHSMAMVVALLLLMFSARVDAGPATGLAPDTRTEFKGEVRLGTTGATLVRSLAKCDAAVYTSMARGKPFETNVHTTLDRCKTRALNKYLAANKKPAADCLAAEGTQETADNVSIELDRFIGLIFCDGSKPAPDILSGRIPDSSAVARQESKFMNAALTLSGQIAKCRKKQADAAIPPGRSFDFALCERQALIDYDFSATGAVPSCVQTNKQVLRDLIAGDLGGDLSGVLDQHTGDVLCQGTEPIDSSGCCQQGFTCSVTADKASCDELGGTFTQGIGCNPNTGLCQPATCPVPKECDPGEDYLNCPENCPPPPNCGNGFCGDPGETCKTCPADCGRCGQPTPIPTAPIVCNNNGVCESGAGENCANCPTDCGCTPGAVCVEDVKVCIGFCCGCSCPTTRTCTDGVVDGQIACASLCTNAGCTFGVFSTGNPAETTCAPSGCSGFMFCNNNGTCEPSLGETPANCCADCGCPETQRCVGGVSCE